MLKFASILLILLPLLVRSDNKQCEDKEQSLALLELAKHSISRANDLIPECYKDENSSYPNRTSCGKKEKTLAFMVAARNLIDQAKKLIPTCKTTCEPEVKSVPIDCLEVQERGGNVSGIYNIQPGAPFLQNRTIAVYCDMETSGGGWTVIQRRNNSKENFYRTWDEYKKGFGSITEDFWLGNEFIYILSNQSHQNQTLRFDLRDQTGEHRFASYSTFSVENEASKYRLHISGYYGDAGDAMERVDGEKFTTKDNVNDRWGSDSCANAMLSGWWFRGCSNCNPNGNPTQSGTLKGLFWTTWKQYESLKSAEMKLRRR